MAPPGVRPASQPPRDDAGGAAGDGGLGTPGGSPAAQVGPLAPNRRLTDGHSASSH